MGQRAKGFENLMEHFRENNYTNDSISPELIHRAREFTITLSQVPLELNVKEVTLESPYRGNPFPISYSVIFRKNLITLFEPGKFVCHQLNGLERNLSLEDNLNSKQFLYAWIIGEELVAKSETDYFYFTDNNTWEVYSESVPLSSIDTPGVNRAKLFEDEKYIVYSGCHGEFGGEIFFYNKQTKETHQTVATCANSVLKNEDASYSVLYNLGHLYGSAGMKVIDNPDLLGGGKGARTHFYFSEIQIFSSFILEEKTFYMVHWRDATFLATIQSDTISIVNPLFDDGLYTHNPITSVYEDDFTLMNLDFYLKGKEREVACIVINGRDLTKITWQEK